MQGHGETQEILDFLSGLTSLNGGNASPSPMSDSPEEENVGCSISNGGAISIVDAESPLMVDGIGQ